MTTILNKGEVCLAGTRVFVHKKVRDAFLDRFRYQLAKVRQGDPVDPATQLGAQSSEVQFKRVNSYIELGKAEGAVALTGGGPAKIAGLENGRDLLGQVLAEGSVTEIEQNPKVKEAYLGSRAIS